MNTPETSSAGSSSSFLDQITRFANAAGNVIGAVKGTKQEPANQPTKLGGDQRTWLPFALIGVALLAVVAFFALRKP
jgi:hypothetical protein